MPKAIAGTSRGTTIIPISSSASILTTGNGPSTRRRSTSGGSTKATGIGAAAPGSKLSNFKKPPTPWAASFPLFRYAIFWSSPAARPVVDDLTQEMYVCLWANEFRVLRQWKCEYPLRAYLRTVIERLVWERLSRLQPRREQLADGPLIEASARHEPW